MADTYKGLTVRFGGDTSDLQSALKSARKAASETQTQLRKVEKALKFDSSDVTALKQKFTLLTDAIGDGKVKLTQYERELEQLGKRTATLDGVKSTVKELAENTSNAALQAEEAQKAYADLVGIMAENYQKLNQLASSADLMGNFEKVQDMPLSTFESMVSSLEEMGLLTQEAGDEAIAMKKKYDSALETDKAAKMVLQFQQLDTDIISTQSNIAELGSKLVALDMPSDLYSGFESVKTEIQSTQAQVTVLDTRLAQLDKALALDPTNLSLLTEKVQVLREKLSICETNASSLQEVLDAYSAAGVDVAAKSTEELASDVQKAADNYTEATEQVGLLMDNLQKLTTSQQKMEAAGQQTTEEYKSCTAQIESTKSALESAKTVQSNALTELKDAKVAQEAGEVATELGTVQERISACQEQMDAANSDLAVAQAKWDALQVTISEAFDAAGLTDFKARLEGVTDAVKTLDDELKSVDKALDLDPSNVALLDTKMDLLAESTRTLQAEAEAVSDDYTALGQKSVTIGGLETTVSELAESTANAALDAADAKTRYETLTSQLKALSDPISEAARMTGELDEAFDLFAQMGAEDVGQTIDKLAELGVITEEQRSKLLTLGEAWQTAAADMDATAQVQEYKQLGTQLETVEVSANDASDQLGKMVVQAAYASGQLQKIEVPDAFTAEMKEAANQTDVLGARMEDTASSLSLLNSRLSLDTSDMELATRQADLLQEYTDQATEKMELLRQRISTLKDAGVEDTAMSMKELEQQVEEAKEAYDGCADEVRELSEQLVVAQTRQDELAGSADASSTEYDEVTAEVEELSAALQEAKARQELAADALTSSELSREYSELNTELDETETELMQVRNAADKAASTTDNLGLSASNSFYALQNFGSLLEQMLSQNIMNALENAMEAADDVDTAFRDMKKTVEGTDEEFDGLLQAAMDYSEVSVTSTTEILEIEELGGQLGIAADELEDFATTVSNLSIATDLEADEAATDLGQLINVVDGLDVSNVDQFSDALVRLGNNGASTESEIADIATRIGATASTMGFTAPEILAWSSTLASTGESAETAGTALTNTMADIEVAVADGGEELDLFAEIAGMSAEEFATAWETDPNEAMKAFVEGLADMEESGDSSVAALEDLGITSVRQLSSLQNLANGIDTLDDNLQMSEDAWNGVSDEWGNAGDAAYEAEQKSEGLSGAISIIQNSLENIGAIIGDALTPVVQSFADFMVDLTGKLADASDESIQMGVAIAAITAAIGPAIVAAGSFQNVFGNVTEWGSEFTGVFKTAASELKTFKGVMSGTSTAAEAMEAVAYSTSDAIGDMSDTTVVSTKNTKKDTKAKKSNTKGTKSLTTAVKGLSKSTKVLMSIGILAAVSLAVEAVKKLSTVIGNMADDTTATEDALSDLDEAIWGVGEEAEDAEGPFSEFQGYLERMGLTDDAETAVDGLADSISDLAEEMEEVQDETSTTLRSYSDAQQAIEDYAGQTGLTTSELGELKSAVELVNDELGTSYTVAQDSEGAWQIVEEGCEDIDESADGARDALTKMLDSASYEALASGLQEQLEGVQDALYEAEDAYDEELSNYEGTVEDYKAALAEAGLSTTTTYGELQHFSLSEVLDIGVDAYMDLLSYGEAMETAAGKVGEAAGAVEDAEGDVEDLNEIIGFVTDTAEDSSSVFSSLSADALYDISRAVSGAEGGFDEGIAALETAVSDYGVSLDKLSTLSYTEQTELFSGWDGTMSDLAVRMSDAGIAMEDAGATSIGCFVQAIIDGTEEDVPGAIDMINQALESGDWTQVSAYMTEKGYDVDGSFAQAVGDNDFVVTDAIGAMFDEATEAGGTEAAESSSELVDSASTAFSDAVSSQTATFARSGTSIATQFAQGIITGSIDADSAMDNLEAYIFLHDWQDALDYMEDLGLDVDSELAEGIANGDEDAINELQQIVDDMGLVAEAADYSGEGAAAMATYLDGVQNAGKTGELTEAFSTVTAGIEATASTVDLEPVGEDVAYGFIEGQEDVLGDQGSYGNVFSYLSYIVGWWRDALQANSPSQLFVPVGEDVAYGFIDGICTGLMEDSSWGKSLSAFATNLESAMTESLSEFGSTISASLNSSTATIPTTMYTLGTTAGQNFATGIATKTSVAQTAVTVLVNSAANGVGSTFSSKMSNAGRTGSAGFVSGIRTYYSQAQTAGTTLGQRVWNGGLGTFRTKMETTGRNGAAGFAEGIEEKGSAARKAGQELGEKVYESGLRNFEKKMEGIGEEGAAGFVDGLESSSARSGAHSAGSTLANRALSGARSKTSSAYSVGQDFASGYASGISSKNSTVYNAAYTMASKAVQAANDAQDSASPSKVMREVGEWFGEGYVIGIESEYDEVERAAAKASALAIEAASADAVASISYETAAQAATASAVLDALERIDSSTSQATAGTVVNQTFDTKVVRADSDLYTAAPILYRSAMREASLA